MVPLPFDSVFVCDEIEDRNRADVVRLEDAFAFGPVRFGHLLVAEVAEDADGDIGQGGKG